MFYLAIVQNDTTAAIYAYQNLDDALAMLHTELAYRGDGRNKTVCSVLNRNGELIRNDMWERENVEELEQSE